MANIASITSAPSYRRRFAPSSQADWSTLRFPRQQSLWAQQCVWERDAEPLEPWWKVILQGICAVFTLAAVCAGLFMGAN